MNELSKASCSYIMLSISTIELLGQLLFKKGEIAWRESGVKSTQQLINIITPHTL